MTFLSGKYKINPAFSLMKKSEENGAMDTNYL